MKNIEKYKGIVLKHLNCCEMESDLRKLGCKAHIDCAHTYCTDCGEWFFKWLLSEAKEPILDDKEREYLSAVIKPYKNYVTGIVKICNSYDKNRYFIRIVSKNEGRIEYVDLPWFKGNTMYKGMINFKEYTLKELGL